MNSEKSELKSELKSETNSSVVHSRQRSQRIKAASFAIIQLVAWIFTFVLQIILLFVVTLSDYIEQSNNQNQPVVNFLLFYCFVGFMSGFLAVCVEVLEPKGTAYLLVFRVLVIFHFVVEIILNCILLYYLKVTIILFACDILFV